MIIRHIAGKTAWEFDERQLRIRGDAYQHGFILAVALLLARMLLYATGIRWANEFTQGLVELSIIIAAASVELLLRGAYFGRAALRKVFLLLWSACAVAVAAGLIRDALAGVPFTQDGMLTEDGGMLAICAMLVINAVCAAIQEARALKAERQTE
jgi:hypothetical protein